MYKIKKKEQCNCQEKVSSCNDSTTQKTKEIRGKVMMGVEGSRNQNKGIIKGFDAVIIPKQEKLSWIPIPTTAKGLLSNRE